MNIALTIVIELLLVVYLAVMYVLDYRVVAYEVSVLVFPLVILAYHMLRDKKIIYKRKTPTAFIVVSLLLYLDIAAFDTIRDLGMNTLLTSTVDERIIIIALPVITALFYIWYAILPSLDLYMKCETNQIRKKLPFKFKDPMIIKNLSSVRHLFIDVKISDAIHSEKVTQLFTGTAQLFASNSNNNALQKFINITDNNSEDSEFIYKQAGASMLKAMTECLQPDGTTAPINFEDLENIIDLKRKVGMYPTVYYAIPKQMPNDKLLLYIKFEGIAKDYTILSVMTESTLPTTLIFNNDLEYADRGARAYFSSSCTEITSDNYEELKRKQSSLCISAEYLQALSYQEWMQIHKRVKFVYGCSDFECLLDHVAIMTNNPCIDRWCIGMTEENEIICDDTNFIKVPKLFEEVARVRNNVNVFEKLDIETSMTFVIASALMALYMTPMPILLPFIMILGVFRYILLPILSAGSTFKQASKNNHLQTIVVALVVLITLHVFDDLDWLDSSDVNRVIFSIYLYMMVAIIYYINTGWRIKIRLYVVLIVECLFMLGLWAFSQLYSNDITDLLYIVSPPYRTTAIVALSALLLYPILGITDLIERRLDIEKIINKVRSKFRKVSISR